MAQWNLGDILDAIEPALPADTPALIHGARVRYSRPKPTMLPRLVSGGCTPSPRKERPLSMRMISGKVSVIETISVEATLGRIWRK